MRGSITYEGVTFVREACASMTKAEFIKAHQCFWADKDAKTRSKMLSEAYKLIAPTSPEATEEK